MTGIWQAIEQHGYPAIFWGIFLESFGLPLPGETLLITGSLVASGGKLLIGPVAALAFAAAVFGDTVGYGIGRWGGRRFMARFGKYIFLGPERFAKLETFLLRNSGKMIVTARFFDGLRQFNGVLAGTCGIGFGRFFFLNAAGAALWVGLWSGVCYVFGRPIAGFIFRFVAYDGWIIAGIAFLVLLLILIKKKIGRKRRG